MAGSEAPSAFEGLIAKITAGGIVDAFAEAETTTSTPYTATMAQAQPQTVRDLVSLQAKRKLDRERQIQRIRTKLRGSF